MKKIYILLLIAIACIASPAMAQNNGYFSNEDYVTLSFVANDVRYYLEASPSGLLTQNFPTDNSLWRWRKYVNGDSYHYTLQDVSTGKYLGIRDYGNNTYALMLKDAETAFLVTEVDEAATTDNYLKAKLSYVYSIVHSEWYTEQRHVYVMYEWVNNTPVFKANTWADRIDIEKWEQKGAGTPTGHFAPSKIEFVYARDEAAANDQTRNVTFDVEATTESYFQCLHRPEEALLRRTTGGVSSADIRVKAIYWESNQATVSTLDASKFVNCPEPNGRAMMTIVPDEDVDVPYTFTITPNGKSPMGLKDKFNQLERWIDYADNVVVEYTYGDNILTERMRVVRKSYHEENLPALTFSINPVTYTFNKLAETVYIDVLPMHQHGTVLYNVDHQAVQVQYEEEPSEVSLNDGEWTLSFNNADWLTVSVWDENTLQVSAAANNDANAQKRSFDLVGTFTQNTEATHTGSFTIPLYQRGEEGGIKFNANQGHSGDELLNGRQQVHTAQRTIYYLPDQEIELRLPESGYSGYMRWYDYDTNGDPVYNDRRGDASKSTSWVRSPRAANGRPFSAINTPQSSETIGQEGYSYGLYAINKGDGGVLDEDNPSNPAPILRGWSQGEAHTMACDVSAYTDYTFEYANNQIKSITEPTLSYRQLFYLRPAAEIAEQLESLAENEFLEEYHYQAPAGKQVLLSTEYRYRKYRSHISEMCYFYKGTDGQIFRIDANTPVVWRAYDKGNNGELQLDSRFAAQYSAELDNLIVRSETPCTKVYLLILPAGSGNGNKELRIARFEVEFVDIEKQGPTTKTIITQQRINAQYKNLAEINFNDVNSHLPWEQISYGYVYDSDPLNTTEFKRGASQGIFPFYGEYTVLSGVNKDWARAEAHGRTGKSLYVDGTMEPGLVATISTNAVICSGQTMYCSAWFCNPAPAGWSGEGNPIFRCNIQGRKKLPGGTYSEWEDAGVYFVGELLKGSGWNQIVFPVKAASGYDETRVSIYNFATTNQGNDFMVDDITLFVSQLPIAAYQGKMACRTTEAEQTNAVAVLRIDYGNINAGANGYMYYQIFNESYENGDGPKGAPMILTGDEGYYHDYDDDANIQDHDHPYGSVHIPQANFDPESYNAEMKSAGKDTVLIYGSVSKFLDDLIATPDTKHAKAYVKTENNGAIKWLLYVAHVIDNITDKQMEDANIPGEEKKQLPLGHLYDGHSYSMRMAYSADELATPECNLTTPLHATQQTVFSLRNSESETIKHTLNGQTLVADKSGSVTSIFNHSTNNCPNDLYFLTAKVINHLAVEGAGNTIEGVEAPILADWLVGYTSLNDTMNNESISQAEKDLAFKNRYGYTPGQVTTAIMYDMRLNDPNNPNYTAKSFEELIPSAFLSQQNYEIIRHLHEHEWIQFYNSTTHFYLEPNATASFWCFPIAETAKTMIDTNSDGVQDTEVILKDCNEPRRVFISSADSDYHVNVAPIETSKKDSRQKMLIPDLKVVATDANNVTIPITNLTEQARNILTVEGMSEGVITLDLEKSNLTFYDLHTGEKLPERPTIIPGEEYTIRLTLKNSSNQEEYPATGTDCRYGHIFVTVQVVPNVLVWQPTGSSFNGWGLNQNWKGWIDKDTDFIMDEGELINGFVPMQGTDVVIPDLGNPLLYPYIVPEHDHDHYPMTVHNDQHTCRDIYFAAGAHIQNQHLLEYRNAFVDMEIAPGKWNSMSAPLRNMYSGDMFIPHDGWWDNVDAKRETLNPFETETFQGIRHADAAYAFWQAFYNQTVTLHHENNGKTIVSPTADFVQSNTMSQELTVGEGFNLKGYGPGNPQVEKSLVIRLPKKDDKYYYYSNSGVLTNQSTETLVRTNANKLAFEPTDGKMILTLNNETEGTDFLLGNPTMAYIDMSLFLAANSELLYPTFKYMRDDAWYGAHPDVPAQSEDRYLPPMRSALVQAKVPATTLELSLNLEHLTLNNHIYEIDQQNEPAAMPRHRVASKIKGEDPQVMTICAYTDRAYARALLAVHPNAKDSFCVGEDASFISSGVETANLVTSPLNIYTLDEQNAMMADVRRNLDSIPLALLVQEAHKRDTMQFAFYLSHNWTRVCYFCDKLTGARYRIMDGLVLNLPMSHNHETRYYIEGPDEKDDYEDDDDNLSSITYPSAVDAENAQLWAYNEQSGLLSVVSNKAMRRIRVYDVAGRRMAEQQMSVLHHQATFQLPAGLYLVEATFADNAKQYIKALLK
ncbi:MAG: hypothetical protein J6U94_03740 [Paludibacteraceae bacterium]|nr:hypothetical protein [Paludibacteraceae bacterium]